jgi:hypothetical protein
MRVQLSPEKSTSRLIPVSVETSFSLGLPRRFLTYPGAGTLDPVYDKAMPTRVAAGVGIELAGARLLGQGTAVTPSP